jgi:hypothetical protein
MTDDGNPLEIILRDYAQRFCEAPGAARLAGLARTAKRIPGTLLADLEVLIAQLDDVQLVGNDTFIHLVEVGYCDAKYADAVAFAQALKTRLQRYVRDPEMAAAAREEFRAGVAWWRVAVAGIDLDTRILPEVFGTPLAPGR